MQHRSCLLPGSPRIPPRDADAPLISPCSISEMLFCTSLVAYVGAGTHHTSPASCTFSFTMHPHVHQAALHAHSNATEVPLACSRRRAACADPPQAHCDEHRCQQEHPGPELPVLCAGSEDEQGEVGGWLAGCMELQDTLHMTCCTPAAHPACTALLEIHDLCWLRQEAGVVCAQRGALASAT